MPWLEVYRRGRKEREYEVPDRGAVLGRDTDCDVVLSDGVVSRKHARLYATGGRWFIEDLETRNGTWVNGLREFRRPLNDGDQIELGPFIITYRQDELELVPGTNPSITPFRQSGFQTPMRPLVYEAKKDPDSTQRLDPKTMARLREEARALMGPHLLQVGSPSIPHPLRRTDNVLGSAPEAHVRVPDMGRDEAALVEVMPSGSFRLRKLGWFTTVRVNGNKVSDVALEDGDEIQIGSAKLVFVRGAK